MKRRSKDLICFSCFVIATSVLQAVQAGPLRERIMERQAARAQQDAIDDGVDDGDAISLAVGVRVMRDISYGADPAQRFDVYLPSQPALKAAPVIFMVHGGGWRRGDKAMQSVVQNKVNRWVPKGFIVVSTNYRMLPDAEPVEQAKDVTKALGVAQARAASWGGDRDRFILMGHSAGAHLVALVAASDRLGADAGTGRPLGVAMLDSAALNVVGVMQGDHRRLHDQAFGSDPRDWIAASPYHRLRAAIMPALAVCSTRRADACPQADEFVAKAVSLGSRASVLPVDLSHRDINLKLGEEGLYTAAVERFLASLDGVVAHLLRQQ